MNIRRIGALGRRICCLVCLAMAVSVSAHAADAATITYRRVFMGSNPEFIEIKVSEQGPCTYDIRQLSEDAGPQPFEVGPAVIAKITQLSGELHNFEGQDLDVHRRIAYLGEKTFRYEKGAEVHETKFNYTIDRTANQLLMIFEGLSQQQQDLMNLQQKLKYDRLGVNDALRQFEDDLGKRTLPEPERLLPVLDRVAADPRIVDVARQRARALAERIRSSESTDPSGGRAGEKP
jgi:hypothetical protein